MIRNEHKKSEYGVRKYADKDIDTDGSKVGASQGIRWQKLGSGINTQ